MVMVFEILNRLKWKGGLERCEIIILHRGAPGNRKTIPGSRVTGLDRHYFYYTECIKSGRETTIPLHRIQEIRLEGNSLWKREPEKQNQDRLVNKVDFK